MFCALNLKGGTMLKMIVEFENGIAVRDIPKLDDFIKSFGGKATFVPLENKEAQNTSTNSRYMTALNTYNEFLSSGEYSCGSGFMMWCRQRLKPEEPACT